MKKLYHISTVPNLEVLQPRTGTHKKPYVYATTNLEFGLLFGSSKSFGDFDGSYGIDDLGRPYFYEAYEGALKRRFDGEKCYVYEVDPKHFKSGKTSFGGEVVSSHEAKVLNCYEIPNLYETIKELIDKGLFDFKEYSNDPEYQKMIHDHIKTRIVAFDIINKPKSGSYKLCQEKFPEILREVEQEANLKK